MITWGGMPYYKSDQDFLSLPVVIKDPLESLLLKVTISHHFLLKARAGIHKTTLHYYLCKGALLEEWSGLFK